MATSTLRLSFPKILSKKPSGLQDGFGKVLATIEFVLSETISQNVSEARESLRKMFASIQFI
jgi:hypothetical protein